MSGVSITNGVLNNETEARIVHLRLLSTSLFAGTRIDLHHQCADFPIVFTGYGTCRLLRLDARLAILSLSWLQSIHLFDI